MKNGYMNATLRMLIFSDDENRDVGAGVPCCRDSGGGCRLLPTAKTFLQTCEQLQLHCTNLMQIQIEIYFIQI